MSGRPLEYRGQIGRKYGLGYPTYRRYTPAFLRQLRDCKTEAARRLLLGVSKKTA